MYAEHVPVIASAMRGDVATFERGVLFAICSIRQPVINVPAQIDDVERERAESIYLIGHKRAAYQYLVTHREALWRDVCSIALDNPAGAIARLCDIPGIGIVKAGFIAQMLGFDVACIDTRNIQRDGRNPRAYRSDGEARKRTPAFQRKIARYVADVGGRAAHYWDAWCNEVGPIYHLTGEAMSALHADAICGDAIPF